MSLSLLRLMAQCVTRRAQTSCVTPVTTSFGLMRANRYSQQQNTSKKSTTDTGFTNEPIDFFGSKAATWRAKDSRSGGSEHELWFQPYVISASLGIFLIYFCILREESDIDRKLEGDLYQHVSGLEEVALSVNYKYNKEHGLDTREQEQRLTELGVNIKKLDAQTNRAVH